MSFTAGDLVLIEQPCLRNDCEYVYLCGHGGFAHGVVLSQVADHAFIVQRANGTSYRELACCLKLDAVDALISAAK